MTEKILNHLGDLICKNEDPSVIKDLCMSFNLVSACQQPLQGAPGSAMVVLSDDSATEPAKKRGRPAKTPDPVAAPAEAPEPPMEVVEVDLVAEDAPPAARTKDDLRNLINGQLKLIDGKDKKATVILAWAEIFKANGAKDTSSLADDKVESVIQGLEAYIAKNLS